MWLFGEFKIKDRFKTQTGRKLQFMKLDFERIKEQF